MFALAAAPIATLSPVLGSVIAAADTAAIDGTWGPFINVVAVFWGLVLAYVGWIIWRHLGRHRATAGAGANSVAGGNVDRRPVVANPFDTLPSPKK